MEYERRAAPIPYSYCYHPSVLYFPRFFLTLFCFPSLSKFAITVPPPFVRVTCAWKIEVIRARITETLSDSSLNDNGQGTPGTLKSSLLLSINNWRWKWSGFPGVLVDVPLPRIEFRFPIANR